MLRLATKKSLCPIVSLNPLNKRYASVVNHVRFINSKATIDKDVQARYQQKLEEKAKALGVADTEELKEKLKDQIEQTKKVLNKIDPLTELENYEKEQRIKAAKKRQSLGPIDPSKPPSPYKTLDSFIKVDKLDKLGLKELEFLWRARFQSKENSLSALVPSDAYYRLHRNARRNPTFVLPLPKEEAEVDMPTTEGTPMEMHFVQWNFAGPHTTHILITSLAEYRLHKEFARPHTTIMFHTELVDSHSVVMMNGQVEERAPITLQESQLLLLNIQRFYGGIGGGTSEASQRRLKLLEAFNQGSSIFSMEELIELAESMEN